MIIGILGGGQLGYMLALAGYPLGLRFRFLDPSPEAPVGRIAPRVTGDYEDEHALERFAHGLHVVTYEFENVPVEAARRLTKRVEVYPPVAALEEAQNRVREKRLFQKLGIAATEYAEVGSRGELDAAVRRIGLPSVLKTCRMGYDGKGQWLLRTSKDVEKARAEIIRWWRIITAEEFCGFRLHPRRMRRRVCRGRRKRRRERCWKNWNTWA